MYDFPRFQSGKEGEEGKDGKKKDDEKKE